MTDAEITQLRNARSEQEWNAICDQIKKRNGGSYPADWYPRVIQGGVVEEARLRYGW